MYKALFLGVATLLLNVACIYDTYDSGWDSGSWGNDHACACAAVYEDNDYSYEESVADFVCLADGTDLQEAVNQAAAACVATLEDQGFYNVTCACSCEATGDSC